MKLPRQRIPSERKFLTLAQAQKLISSLQDPYRLLVAFAVLTGLRRGELFGLKWKYVDLERRILHVREALYEGRFTTPKTASSVRDIPLGDAAFEGLLKHREGSNAASEDSLVFCTEEGLPFNPQSVLKAVLYPACDVLGLPRVGWHGFRHTHATLLGDLGESIKTAQELLGHSDLDTTLSIYTHAVPESKRKAVERLGEVLFPTVPKFSAGNELTN